jgi:tetratricopeptide (TPR) repeat protein
MALETDPLQDGSPPPPNPTPPRSDVSPTHVAELLSALTRAVEASRANDKPKGRLEAWGERFTKVVGALTTVAKGLVSVLAVILLADVIRDALEDDWQIDGIAVPQAWEQQGYSSKVFVEQMKDEIGQIGIDSKTELGRGIASSDVGVAPKGATRAEDVLKVPPRRAEVILPDLQIPGAGLTTKALSEYIRSIVGERRKRVTGEVVLEEQNAILTIRVRGRGGKDSATKALRSLKTDPSELIRLGAAFVMERRDPCGLAAAYVGRKQFSASLDTIGTCLSVAPTDSHSWVYSMWGLILAELEDRAAAVDKFKKAIELDPTNAMAYNNLGYALEVQRDYEGAISNFQKAIALDKRLLLSYNNWANVLQDQGRYDDAIKKLKEAIDIDNKSPDAYINWGNVLVDRRDYAEAVVQYQKANEIAPNNPIPFNNWGFALESQKDYAGAAEKYRRALQRDEKYVTAHINLGNVLRQLGDRGGARASYQKVVELDADGTAGALARKSLNELKEPSRPLRTAK